MKITQTHAQLVKLPVDEPLADGPLYQRPFHPFIALDVRTDSGIEGIGYTTFAGPLSATLRDAVERLGELIIGDDPLRTEAISRKLRSAAAGSGPSGIFTLALAAIDIALWDIKGKALNQSLAMMLGGLRDKVPTYASGALLRSHSTDELLKAGRTLVERGWKQMKSQMALPGETRPRIEAERAHLLREAIGPDIDLMCDINQRWSVNQAIDIGQRVKDVHFFWLEDVTVHDDYSGQARVADALATPLAAGECLYGITPFRHAIEARAMDIVMIDLFRVGGISNWMKVAGMAEAFNLPVVSHLIPEIHVHLVAAISNGLTVEYMPWSFHLFEEVPVPVKGELAVPTKPGLGLAFDRAALKKYAA